MSDRTPRSAAQSPIGVAVEAGKSYFWCSCGHSSNQPFCDGSHKGSGFTPIEFKAETSETVYFCACKLSGTPPRCDGSHKRP
jgi:CDGSH-type Zn-finger protein